MTVFGACRQRRVLCIALSVLVATKSISHCHGYVEANNNETNRTHDNFHHSFHHSGNDIYDEYELYHEQKLREQKLQYHQQQHIDIQQQLHQVHHQQDHRRVLDASPQYYWSTESLGDRNNYDVTLGNPLRGLASDPGVPDSNKSGIAYSVEVFYFPFSAVVVGPNQYNWTVFEDVLNAIQSRKNHGVPRFFIDYPGNPLALPQFLIDTVKMEWYPDMGGGRSPNYGDVVMLQALKDFIYALGRKYDGDRRLFCIQAGLLGFWGEWHVMGNTFLPDSTRDSVMQWYDESFDQTHIQMRYPTKATYERNFGYYDDSFTWYTLDGEYDGGTTFSFYFFPRLLEHNISDFWKVAPMGGEVRPENVGTVFEPGFPAGTKNHQDFYYCSQLTHSTYNKVGGIMGDFFMSREEIDKANWNNARMGYSYQINSVTASVSSTTSPGAIDVDVVLENNGIAPFYYPLALTLNCAGIGWPHSLGGVETILDQYTTKTFYYQNVPATPECLSAVTFGFESKWLYPDRPIKFAQGNGTVTVQIPLPPENLRVPTPTSPPALAPVPSPPTTSTSAPIVTTALTIDVALMDTKTNKEYGIESGITFDLSDIGASLTMLAYVLDDRVKRVEFDWMDGMTSVQQSENSTPWTMGGDTNDGTTTTYNVVPYLTTPGPKQVSITAFSDIGTILGSRTAQFNMVGTPPSDMDITFVLTNQSDNQGDVTVTDGAIIDLSQVGTSISLRAEL